MYQKEKIRIIDKLYDLPIKTVDKGYHKHNNIEHWVVEFENGVSLIVECQHFLDSNYTTMKIDSHGVKITENEMLNSLNWFWELFNKIDSFSASDEKQNIDELLKKLND